MPASTPAFVDPNSESLVDCVPEPSFQQSQLIRDPEDRRQQLQALRFRKSAPAQLIQAAAAGDESRFAKLLKQSLNKALPGSSRQQNKLRTHWERLEYSDDLTLDEGASETEIESGVETKQGPAGSIVAEDSDSQFSNELSQNPRADSADTSNRISDLNLWQIVSDTDLTESEISARIIAELAAVAETTPTVSLYCQVCSLLLTSLSKLSPECVLDLWLWALSANQQPLEERDDSLKIIEGMLLSGWIFDSLKGEHQSARLGKQALTIAVDSLTDTDGTPHGTMLPEFQNLFDRLSRLQILARFRGESIWSKKTSIQLKKLLGRVLSLVTPTQMIWNKRPIGEVISDLRHYIEIMQFEFDPATEKLLKAWDKQKSSTSHRTTERLISKSWQGESHQSDWGSWGVLRSTWAGVIDVCAIRHIEGLPELELLTKDIPFITGRWELDLKLDGVQQSTNEGWECSCWFEDGEAAYLELQLSPSPDVRILRHVLLMKHESTMVLGDSIRLATSQKIEYRRSHTTTDHWNYETDGATREAAFCLPEDADGVRIRVLPVTAPQYRHEQSEERLSFSNQRLTTEIQTTAKGLHSVTVFDWSTDRRDEPTDWQSLTIAEDGQRMLSQDCRANRWRIGTTNRVIYHTFVKPRIPRTIMGIHTPNETVIAEVTTDGDFKTLVEVAF